MAIRKIDDDFSVGAQIAPEDIPALASAGYRTIVCARPDNEDPDQPDFATIADAARASGMTAVHIPVSGPPGENQVNRFRTAWPEMAKPVIGYCRSGGRAEKLYAARNADA